jgi:hypothetical protein
VNYAFKKFAAPFALILIVAAVPRCAGLAASGIFGVDDGRYFLDGLSKVYEIETATRLFEEKWVEVRGGESFLLAEFVPEAAETLSKEHPFAPKQGFAYLTAMVMVWTGPWVSATCLVEAIAGVLLVAALIGFVGTIRDWPTGLLAGAMLAVSGYSVYFARNAYPQSAAALLFLLAVWALALADRPQQSLAVWRPLGLPFASGMLAGLSFWVNYQAAGAIPALAVVHALRCCNQGGVAGTAKRFVSGGILITAGFLAVMVFAEAITYPWIVLFRSQGMEYPHGTFFELLWPRLTSQAGAPVNPSGLLLFPFFYGLLEGYPAAIAATIVLCASGVVALRNRASVDKGKMFQTVVYLIVPFIVPLLIFSLKTMQGARTFTFALPFFLALLAIAVVALWRQPTRYPVAARSIVAVLLAIWTVSNLVHIRETVATRSAYAQLMTYLDETYRDGACAAWSSVLESYLIQEGREGGSIYQYIGEGRTPPPLYVSDWQELYESRYPDEAIALPLGAKPIAEFDHAFGRVFLEVEAFPSYGNTIGNIRFVRNLELDRARKLLVYDLRRTGLRAPLAVPEYDVPPDMAQR